MMSYVVKRDGRRETCKFDKITARIIRLSYGVSQEYVDCFQIAQKVVQGVYPGVTTSQLDELAAETAAYLSTNHPDYGVLAARIAVSNLQKNTKKSFSDTVKIMYEHMDPKTGDRRQLISDDIYKIVMDNAEILDSAIIYDRDFNYDYFGFKTLERSYLLRINGKVVERPQHMLMRVSVGIHQNDISAAIETYNYMSEKFFTHASPTLFNSGTPRPQLSSCFLVNMESDSIEGIYNTLKKCAVISKSAGGIGLSAHCIRAKGSYIKGTNGYSNGLVPMLRVFNDTARYVDQGGGKRKGAIAIYLEPWHADVFEFLELKKNHGIEEQRARDLFFALWVPDLFMKRVEANGVWSLFCPYEAPGLDDCWGEAFEKKYEEYEKKQLFKKQVKAQDLWFAILESQIQTGTPYLVYKDSCNSKSNQKNLGTIKSSNLCTEIVEFSSPDEIAVCNLASISLPKCVESGFFNFKKLAEVTRVVTKNLNKIIDINHYPLEETKRSNLRHRPIGIGIQGLADVFLKLRYPFESDQARVLNRDIFETIYFAALDPSCTLAERDGAYETYQGSPVSQGILQFDMWDQKPNPSLNLDWAGLRERIRQHGVRNSLLIAPMPTASTSQILGNNEAFEPYTSNLYTRRVLAGEFTVVNHHLLKDLTERGIWNERIKQGIIAANGSVQSIPEIPPELKELYKTVWEIKQRTLIDMAADRGAFIDQSQSFNVFIGEPSFGKLTSMHFYAWKKGLKTGMYYLRTKPACDAIKFTLDSSMLAESVKRKDMSSNDNIREAQRHDQMESMVCSLTNKDACISCGS